MAETGHAVSEEHRAKQRVSLLTAVTTEGKRPPVRFGKSENISEGGMRIKSSEMLPLDPVIMVRFLLPVHPETIAVNAKARPVWMARGYSMGIQFLDLKEEYREAIAKFVEGA